MSLRKLIIVAALFAACDNEPPIEPTPDSGVPPVPEKDVVGDAVDLFVQNLSEPVEFARLVEDGVLVADDDGARLIETATVTELGDVGQIAGAATIDDRIVVASDMGFYVIDQGALVRSPLSDAMSGQTAVDLLGVGASLYIPTTTGLHRWTDGTSVPISAGDLPTGGARIAWSQDRLWVAAGDTLYALDLSGTPTAYPELIEGPFDGLAANRNGRLFVIIAGVLHSRAPDGSWREHDAVSNVRAIRGAGAAVWIDTATGLWRHENETFHPTTGAPAGELLAADEVSAVLDSGARVFSELRVDLVGIQDNELVGDVTQVEIRPVLEAGISGITATLNGDPLTVTDQTVEIDPGTLADGSHELKVVVAYDTLPDVEAILRFSVYVGPPPAWSTDVQPLFDLRCALCHGEQGSARLLHTRQLWMEQFAQILDNVRTGRMPLPPVLPLEPAELAVIEGWQSANFPE